MSLRAVSGAILMIPVSLMFYSISLSVAHHSAPRSETFHEAEPPAHDLGQAAGIYAPPLAPADIGGLQRSNTRALGRKPTISGKVSVALTPRPDQVTNPAALDKLSWRVRGF